MAYTSHGHHIMGTAVESKSPISRARCGGPGLCVKCSFEASVVRQVPDKEKDMPLDILQTQALVNLQNQAKSAVLAYYNVKAEVDNSPSLTEDDVFIVWFCKTLQNWKALVGTNALDQRYYEVTYNGDKKELYLDVYDKFENVVLYPQTLT